MLIHNVLQDKGNTYRNINPIFPPILTLEVGRCIDQLSTYIELAK